VEPKGGLPVDVEADRITVRDGLVVLVKQPGRGDTPDDQFAVPLANLISVQRQET